MSNTTNLNLFKHDNPEQNTNAFDVEEALNKNWDKIDTYAGNTDNDIALINSSITSINGDITNINTEQTTQNTNIQTNANNISSLNTRVGTIQTEQTTQNNKIFALETDNTTNKTNIATLQTDSGHIISLDLNTTTYVLTATLKNKQGTTLNTSSIDLPVEQLVVSVSYDENTKELVITLKNGEITRVPLGDLVSGLQTEITSSNKLSSDLVDDTNNTHKFVSTGEKQGWDAKYNKPSGGIPKTDLTTEVQTSLGKADTALQQHQDISGKEDKSNKVTSIDDESTDIQYPSAKCVYDSQQNQNAKIVKLELENQRLKQTLVTTTGTGETITLNKTAEMDFVIPPLPRGNTVQDGEPTPTNPVEVQVVKGNVKVKVENKNLFNKNSITENYRFGSSGDEIYGQNYFISDYIKIKDFSTCVFNRNMTWEKRTVLYDVNKNVLSVKDSGTTVTINENENVYYLRFCDLKTEINNIQIEKGSTATTYTSHQEQILPLTLGNIELCKIGDYQDYIYKNSGKWYLHKEIGKVDLAQQSSTKLGNNLDHYTSIPNIRYVSSNTILGYGLMEKYKKSIGSGLSTHINCFAIDVDTVNINLGPDVSKASGLFYYALLNFENTEITDTTLINQLEAINNAISYYEQTNISGTSSGISPLFDVEAYQSTKLLLENALDRLEILES